MKRKLLFVALATCLFSLHTFSQEFNFRSAREKNNDKTSLFINVAERTAADVNLMQTLFTHKMGQSITAKFTNNLQLNGHVVMTEQEAKLQSITIRCTNFPNALFTLSKVTLEDGTVQYTGAILNNQHKDVISLEKDSNGNYAWIKKSLSDLLPD